MPKSWRNKNGEPLCDLHGDGEPDENSNECDTPDNCAVCGKLCDYTLTQAGQTYVLDVVRMEFDAMRPDGRWLEVRVDDSKSYYCGCHRLEILRDWVKDLKRYGGLPRGDKWLIDFFLERTNYLSEDPTST